MCRVVKIIGLLLLVCNMSAKAQQINYSYIDSLSYHQYLIGDWNSLLKTGKLASKNKIDFPNLQLRLGYAAYQKENFSAAQKHYKIALNQNSYNLDARYFLCNSYLFLSRSDLAKFNASLLNDSIKKSLKIGTKNILEQFDLETSFKTSNNEFRKLGQFYRVGAGFRLHKRVKLYTSISSYHQTFAQYETTVTPQGKQSSTLYSFLVYDLQAYFKLNILLSSNLEFSNAFHYTKTNYDGYTFNTAISSSALKYYFNYFDVKAEFNVGQLLGNTIFQTALSSTYYPFGNLKLYGNTRIAFQNSNGNTHTNFAQTIGVKLAPKLWLETTALFGQINNYIDQDALYIFDAIDLGNYRFGGSMIMPLKSNFNLSFNYYLENRTLYNSTTKYNLNSLTLSAQWKL